MPFDAAAKNEAGATAYSLDGSAEYKRPRRDEMSDGADCELCRTSYVFQASYESIER